MENGIAIAGNLIVDYVKKIDAYPKPGMLCNIHGVSRSIGGCAANTGIDIKMLDETVPVRVFGSVGDDENGRYVTDCLAQYGVDISGIIVKRGVDTSFTDVMTEESDGKRTFFHARGANAEFGIGDIDFSTLNGGLFHIGYALLLDAFDAADSEYGTVMARALSTARGAGCKTSLDVVSEESDRYARVVTPSLGQCSYAILNEVESSLVCGIAARDESGTVIQQNMRRICEKLFMLGVGETVCIHAPEGGWYMDAAGQYLFVPSLTLPRGYIKGSVGAGDAFCAGMLYSIYKGFDPAYSLRVASASAAASLSDPSAVGGMRPLTRVMQLDAKYRVEP